MGTLLITDNDGRHLVPLSSSALIGRHFHCSCPINDPAIHLYWLEIRWFGQMWVWRVLAGANRTRGSGVVLEEGWRELRWVRGRGSRIVWDERCVVELVEPGPPELCGRFPKTNRWIHGEEMEKHVEAFEDGLRAVTDPSQEPLHSGDFIHTPEGLLQIYLPAPPKQTDVSLLSVTHPELKLDIDLTALNGVFTVGQKEARVAGECVRVLAAYAMARQKPNDDRDGWITRGYAHQMWIKLGGKADSPEARVAWERGKLRTQLAKQRVQDLPKLFGMKDHRGRKLVRLEISPERIFVAG